MIAGHIGRMMTDFLAPVLSMLAPGTPGFLALCLLGLFGMINVLSYAAFGLDKRRAESGDWRVPERTLLMLAMLGGWLGAKLAQRRFRHKTSKEPFRSRLNRIGWLHLVMLVLLQTPVVPMALDLALRGDAGLVSITQSLRDGIGTGLNPTAKKSALPHRFGPGSG